VTLRGTNQEFGRPYNRRIVLETIRLSAPISRADIADKVGLTVQTVANITRELELQGFIRGVRQSARGRGHPPTALAVNPEGGFAIGLHVTPIGVDAALINLAGDVIARRERAAVPGDPRRALRLFGEMVRDIRSERPAGRMLGIGMAMPGPMGVESMSFVGPTTLEGWQGVDIAERLESATGLPAFVGVDIAAAALGDQLYGIGRAHRDFYYLYFGVGLGGTMVHDGVALRGARGNAGEIGHLPLVPGGELCPCGNRGCLELYLSLDALDRRLRAADRKADLRKAMAEGSPAIETWIAEAAPLFRAAVATIENLFDPETIVVGGMMPESLLARLIAAAEPLPHSIAEHAGRTVPRLVLTGEGKDAVLRGAAALAVSGVLSPRFGVLFAGEEDKGERDPIMARPEAIA
jgi:predicted NBD/HSP70 family sugar kinase